MDRIAQIVNEINAHLFKHNLGECAIMHAMAGNIVARQQVYLACLYLYRAAESLAACVIVDWFTEAGCTGIEISQVIHEPVNGFHEGRNNIDGVRCWNVYCRLRDDPPVDDPTPKTALYTGGAIAIANERHRQISREDFDSEHDDRHADGSLAIAACCYAEMAACQALDSQRAEQAYGPGHQHWPWHKLWWKPRDARSNLVRAGALIAAEIDRLDRAALRGMGAVRQ